MTDLPQVGQKYQHKKWGEVIVWKISKLGRGYRVHFQNLDETIGQFSRLKDFQKATN